MKMAIKIRTTQSGSKIRKGRPQGKRISNPLQGKRKRRRCLLICPCSMRSLSKSWSCSWSTYFRQDKRHKNSSQMSSFRRMWRPRRSTSTWLSWKQKTFGRCSRTRVSAPRLKNMWTLESSSSWTKATQVSSCWRTSEKRWNRWVKMKHSWTPSRKMYFPMRSSSGKRKPWPGSSEVRTCLKMTIG